MLLSYLNSENILEVLIYSALFYMGIASQQKSYSYIFKRLTLSRLKIKITGGKYLTT